MGAAPHWRWGRMKDRVSVPATVSSLLLPIPEDCQALSRELPPTWSPGALLSPRLPWKESHLFWELI